MFDNIKADFDRYRQLEQGADFENSGKRMRIWFHGYGLQALVAQRFYRWTLENKNIAVMICKLPLLPFSFILHKIVGRMYDIIISPHALIEGGCYIGHFGGISIGSCRIGKFCNINHQVKIGNFSLEDSVKQVVIGERVWVGAHSAISEGVHVRNGVAISAGTFIDADLPDEVLVAGRSGRVLKHKYDNSALLGFNE